MIMTCEILFIASTGPSETPNYPKIRLGRLTRNDARAIDLSDFQFQLSSERCIQSDEVGCNYYLSSSFLILFQGARLCPYNLIGIGWIWILDLVFHLFHTSQQSLRTAR